MVVCLLCRSSQLCTSVTTVQDPTRFWDGRRAWPILDLNSSLERSRRELSIDFGVIVSVFDMGKWCRVPCGDRSPFTQNWQLRDDSKSKKYDVLVLINDITRFPEQR